LGLQVDGLVQALATGRRVYYKDLCHIKTCVFDGIKDVKTAPEEVHSRSLAAFFPGSLPKCPTDCLAGWLGCLARWLLSA